MTNADVFRIYGSERLVIEEMLNFLLQEYDERKGENKIRVIRDFMNQETIADIEFAELSKLTRLKENVVSVQ